MIHAVADTHALLWQLFADPRLSSTARAVFESAAAQPPDTVAVSAIRLVEVAYLVNKGRLPETTHVALAALLDQPQTIITVVAVNRTVAQAVTAIPRDQVPDMPDRIIAAGALHLGVPVISRDGKITASGISTIWSGVMRSRPATDACLIAHGSCADRRAILCCVIENLPGNRLLERANGGTNGVYVPSGSR